MRNAFQARVLQRRSQHRLPLCADSNIGTCAKGSYVVSGDIVLVRKQSNGFDLVNFVNADGQAIEGWVRRDRIEPVSEERGVPSGWQGEWVSHDGRDPHVITFTKAAGPAEFYVTGDATFGQNDPWRVEYGGVNLGDFSGRFSVRGDEAVFVEGPTEDEPFNCKLKFRKLGVFLIVADNRQCGGHQVSFDGVYRKFADLRR